MRRSDQAPVHVDFFCIGVGKSGSTWLAQCLDEHPDITIAKNKEPNFFVRKLSAFGGEINEKYMKDWLWYANQYAHAHPAARFGDFSVNLMHNVEDAPQIIKKYYPDAKIIVIMRDPVKRTYSHYWHEKYYDRVPGVPETFEEAINNEELIFRSSYGKQLTFWRKYFEKESFFLIFDFDFIDDPINMIGNLFQFIGVDEAFSPPSLFTRVNQSTSTSPLLGPLRNFAKRFRLAGLGSFLDLANRLGLQPLVRQLLVRRRIYPPMKKETAEILRRKFADDIALLENLFGVDAEPWK